MDTHRQHNDDPHDGDPVRPGRHCGPDCDLFEDPEMTDDERANAEAAAAEARALDPRP